MDKKTKYSKVLGKQKKKIDTKYNLRILLDLTLSTLGFRNDFYSFKRKLTSIIARNQLLNVVGYGQTKSNELHISFLDFINPGHYISKRLNKESTKHLINLFDKVLEQPSFRLLILYFEGVSYEIYGTSNQNKEYFEKITKLSYQSTLENYINYLKRIKK